MSTRLFFIPQGILLVYDITNSWSFDGIDRWIREIDEVILFKPFLVYKERQGIRGEGGVYHVSPVITEKGHSLLVSTV